MKQFFRIFRYLAKSVLLDFSFSFWTILYPILLGSLFYFAFGNIDNRQMDVIPVAVADNSMAKTILQEVDILEVTPVESDAAGKELLFDKKVEGYIEADFSLNVRSATGLEPTIIRRVLDQIVQAQALGMDARHLDFEHQYTRTVDQEGSFMTLAFYALLASVCFYAMFNSIYMCTLLQPNLSELGARLAMTPLSKGMMLWVSFLLTVLLNLLANLLFVAYAIFILKIPLFQEVGLSLLVLTMGNIAATAFGFAVGYSSRLSLEAKSNITLIVNLLLSAFAGMMGPMARLFIEKTMPFLNEWNPIGLVTNTLLRVNNLGQPQVAWTAVAGLALYSVIAYGIAYGFLRRVQYDSV